MTKHPQNDFAAATDAGMRAQAWVDQRLARSGDHDEVAAAPPPDAGAEAKRDGFLHPNALVPPKLRPLLGDPPLLPREDPQAYENLFSAVSHKFAPLGAIEWLFVKEFVDLTWERQRLDGVKRHLITRNMRTHLGAKIADVLRAGGMGASAALDSAKRLVARWSRHDPEAEERIYALLGWTARDACELAAQSVQENLEVIERIDRMSFTALAARQALFRDMERRRDFEPFRPMGVAYHYPPHWMVEADEKEPANNPPAPALTQEHEGSA